MKGLEILLGGRVTLPAVYNLTRGFYLPAARIVPLPRTGLTNDRPLNPASYICLAKQRLRTGGNCTCNDYIQLPTFLGMCSDGMVAFLFSVALRNSYCDANHRSRRPDSRSVSSKGDILGFLKEL